VTVCASIRVLRRAALCLALAALTPLAFAQRGGGGGAPGGGGGAPGGGGQHGGANAGMQPGGGAGTSGGYHGPNGMPSTMGPPIRSAPMVMIPGRFWDDNGVARSLKLRPEQQRRMDAIFEANRTTLVTLFTNLRREEVNLSSMSPKHVRDQTWVFAAIDRVAQARADLEKEKAQLALELRKEMDPQQVAQFEQMGVTP
jgi:Spy/CpxP family protein refolding chaperone